MKMKQCFVFACPHNAWRRNLCKFHHRSRQLLTEHCTQQHCYKPLFGDSLFCKFHFREQYAMCLFPQCSEKTYTTHLCRKHYREGVEVEIPTCSDCDRPVFVFNKCSVHVFPKHCIKCDKPARALGLCTVHYYREYRRDTKSQ